nr:S1 family peptidase [Mycolicibacillus trivialis]
MRLKRGLAALVAVTAMSTGLPVAPAAAATPVLIGGGAAIAVNGTPCTLTTIGHDGSGEVVGLTSAHCGGPGAVVAAGWSPDPLGSVAAADAGLDYAVIRFDAAKVAPIPDFAGFAIDGIGPDAAPGQQACKNSRINGVDCVTVSAAPAPEPHTVLLHVCGDPGDSGAPVTVGDLLVGMMRGGFPGGIRCPEKHVVASSVVRKIPDRAQPAVTSITAIIGDVNAKGGPGAGFVPVPR